MKTIAEIQRAMMDIALAQIPGVEMAKRISMLALDLSPYTVGPQPATPPPSMLQWPEWPLVGPSPWPIDAKILTDAEKMALGPDGERRANMWSNTAILAGGNNLAGRFWAYRGPFVKSADLNADIHGSVWEAIWKAVVKQPVPEYQAPDAGWEKINEAYRARAPGAVVAPPIPEPQREAPVDEPVGN